MGGEKEGEGISTVQGHQQALGGHVVVVALLHGHGARVNLSGGAYERDEDGEDEGSTTAADAKWTRCGGTAAS